MSEIKEFSNATSAINFIKESIDLYWNKTQTESQLKTDIKGFLKSPKNRGFIYRGDNFTPATERLGKKRMAEFKEILLSIENNSEV